jgi:hypothetical protein
MARPERQDWDENDNVKLRTENVGGVDEQYLQSR